MPLPFRRRTLRGRRGSLRELPDMPLDILFEVFSHMEPFDLLNLTRTTKPFRELLLHRSAASFWKQARQNVANLPECPPFMSEPAFINLCFDSHCHKCLRPNIQNVIWAFRARYCRQCKSEMTVTILQARQILEEASPFHAYHDVRELLISETSGRGTFHSSDLHTLVDIWKGTGPEAQQEVCASQSELVKQVRYHAELCAWWQMDRKNVRSTELAELRDSRYVNIIVKLRELGWGELIDSSAYAVYRGLRKVHGVRQPKALTSRSWQTIREPVLRVMETIQSARSVSALSAVLPSRLRTLGDAMHSFRADIGLCFPGIQDFARMPEVRSILDVPGDIELSYRDFEALRPKLSGLVENWRSKKRQELRDILIKEIAAPPDGLNIFNLAVTLCYRCLRCSARLIYPGVLAHTCSSYRDLGELLPVVDYYISALDSQPLPWTRDTIKVETDVLRAVITARGRDPSTATIDDMDGLDALYRIQYDTPIVTWRAEAYGLLDNIDHGCYIRPSSPDVAAYAGIIPSELAAW
ncbi:unnamed protein product [Somion occarium]|uniref:F-box domain-containing protein n=1 Tax=Somion occarium TaxID=3059160 RepID=A0ABP1CEW0_9APHY